MSSSCGKKRGAQEFADTMKGEPVPIMIDMAVKYLRRVHGADHAGVNTRDYFERWFEYDGTNVNALPRISSTDAGDFFFNDVIDLFQPMRDVHPLWSKIDESDRLRNLEDCDMEAVD